MLDHGHRSPCIISGIFVVPKNEKKKLVYEQTTSGFLLLCLSDEVCSKLRDNIKYIESQMGVYKNDFCFLKMRIKLFEFGIKYTKFNSFGKRTCVSTSNHIMR